MNPAKRKGERTWQLDATEGRSSAARRRISNMRFCSSSPTQELNTLNSSARVSGRTSCKLMGFPLTDARMEFISFRAAPEQKMPVAISSITVYFFTSFDIDNVTGFYLYGVQDNINCKVCKCKSTVSLHFVFFCYDYGNVIKILAFYTESVYFF